MPDFRWFFVLVPIAGIAVAQTEPATPAPVEERLRTEWVIAPEGEPPPDDTGLPADAVPGEGMALPPETLPPEGVVVPAAPPAPGEPALTPAPGPSPAAAEPTGVPHVSGGIGVLGRAEMEAVKPRFNLRLLFAVQGSGSYLADVKVRIDDLAGPTLLDAVSQGPWFYASLAPGGYVLTVDNAGQVQTREVTVPETGAIEQAFYWSD